MLVYANGHLAVTTGQDNHIVGINQHSYFNNREDNTVLTLSALKIIKFETTLELISMRVYINIINWAVAFIKISSVQLKWL